MMELTENLGHIKIYEMMQKVCFTPPLPATIREYAN